MKWSFTKYHGTGNDFIIIDDRAGTFPAHDQQLIAAWCTRRFGIGADGLMLLQRAEGVDFRMVYFNSDGRESSMCGNGGRCIVHYAGSLGMITDTARFLAIDGMHKARLADGQVFLQMQDVAGVERAGSDCVVDTGSPHYVRFQSLPDAAGLLHIAKEIRYSDRFAADGINVNLAEQVVPGHLRVRTYERGVEAETFSCGTGVVACAVSDAHLKGLSGPFRYELETLGGRLTVTGNRSDDGSVTDIWLIGPAARVYEGVISDFG